MAKLKTCFAVLVLASCHAFSQTALDIQTTEYPPYQYQNGNQVDGISADLVRAILAEAGLQGTITIYPWGRAQVNLMKSDVLFFNLSRTAEREEHFQWIADITPSRLFFWKLKNRSDIALKHIVDAAAWKIGALPNEVSQKYLLQNGVLESQFVLFNRNEQGVDMLRRERFDLVVMDETAFWFTVKQRGYDPALFEKSLALTPLNSDAYLVASKSVPADLVRKLKDAWAVVKKRRSVQK
jgi:polar amino acid transport system substrate-binding protein